MNEIIPNILYVGSASSVKYANEFDLIVNCTTDIREPKQCKRFIRIPIRDEPDDIANTINRINESNIISTIHTAVCNNERVLVHCYAGEQRSCTIIACYLCKYKGMTVSEAVSYIRERHPNAFSGGVNLIESIF